MADAPPPPPAPEYQSASKAAETSKAAEKMLPPEQEETLPGKRLFEALLSIDALMKLVNHDKDPSAIAGERKEPPLLKAAIAWAKVGVLKRANGMSVDGAEYSHQQKMHNFGGNLTMFVKHLHEWMEARWAWLEKDTFWKTNMQRQTENFLVQLEKERPESKGFYMCWEHMLEWSRFLRPVVEDLEMEGLELDLIAAWLFTTSIEDLVNAGKKKPAGGNSAKRNADSSTSASVPSSAAHGTPASSSDKPTGINEEASGNKKKNKKKKKKKKTGTSSCNEPINATAASNAGPSLAANGSADVPPEMPSASNTEASGNKKKKNKKKKKTEICSSEDPTAIAMRDLTASVAGLSLAENDAPGSSSNKPSTADTKTPNGTSPAENKASGKEPATATNDTAISNASPSSAANGTPGAPLSEKAASKNTMKSGNGDGSRTSPAIDSELDPVFMVELFLSQNEKKVKEYAQLPSNLAETLLFKLFPETVIINTLLVASEHKVENIDPAFWDTFKKITGITADFRVAQQGFEDRLNKRFEAVCKKAKRAAMKKRKRAKKEKQEAEYDEQLEELKAEIEEMEAARAAQTAKT